MNGLDAINIIDALIEARRKANERLAVANERFERLRRECGDCAHWMKSRSCPRERHHRVSCGEPVCSRYAARTRGRRA